MVHIVRCELFVVYLLVRALPSLRSQIAHRWFRLFCMLTSGDKGKVSKHKHNGQRTAHRTHNKAGTPPSGAYNYLARKTIGVFTAEYVQTIRAQLDIYRLVAKNQ